MNTKIRIVEEDKGNQKHRFDIIQGENYLLTSFVVDLDCSGDIEYLARAFVTGFCVGTGCTSDYLLKEFLKEDGDDRPRTN